MFMPTTGSGWRKAVVVTTTVFAGLVGTIILAGPASAHNNTMNAPTTICDSSTGTYTVTYTGQGDYNLNSTVTVYGSPTPSGTTITPSSQLVKPTKVGNAYQDRFTLVQTAIPGTAKSASLSVNELWTDGVHVVAKSPVVTLAGTCKQTTVATSPTFTADVCNGYTPAGASYTIPAVTGVDYKVDGAIVAAGKHTVNDNTTVTIVASAQPGYTLTGTTTFTHTFGGGPTCTTSVVATDPTFTDDVCRDYSAVGATYTVRAVTGVIYKINGTTIAAGTYHANDGSTVTITASAAAGYTLTGPTTFTHTFIAVPTCTSSSVTSTPSFSDDVCVNYVPAGASYTVPTATGVVYEINGSTIAAGKYSAADGSTVTITTAPAAGYTLTGPTSFTHTFTKVPTCTITQVSSTQLAYTGTATSVPLATMLGAILVGLGGMVLVAAAGHRRRGDH